MIISEEKYCIASIEFPLKFYRCGNETDYFEQDLLRSFESATDELSTYDEPEKFQILKVKATYEF